MTGPDDIPDDGPDDDGPRRILDFHTHIASEMVFPASFVRGVVDNMAVQLAGRGLTVRKDKIARMHATTLQDPWCDRLVAEMDEAGIEQSVLLVPDFTRVFDDCTHTIEESIEHHRQVRDRHPGRFRVFAGVDPRWGEDGVALFERSLRDLGFDGMKLYPPCGYRLDDRGLYPFYEICSAYGVPVLTHIGPTTPTLEFEPARPIFVDRAAMDFPDVDFVLAHGSVSYADECAMLCANRPNVYIDVSGYEIAELSRLNAQFRRGINHKILFATDWPVFRMQGTQKQFVDRLTTGAGAFPEDMSEPDKDLFFSGNALRLLGKRAAVTGVRG